MGDHAYTLLNVIELHGNRLLYLRNPWGRKEWSGRWSHVSSEWTAELKTAVNYAYQPGAFWISFEDFIQYYESVTVCYANAAWSYQSSQGIDALITNAYKANIDTIPQRS